MKWKVIMVIMFARTLNDHVSYRDVGRLCENVKRGAERALIRAAVIRFSKSVGSGRPPRPFANGMEHPPARLRNYSMART